MVLGSGQSFVSSKDLDFLSFHLLGFFGDLNQSFSMFFLLPTDLGAQKKGRFEPRSRSWA